MLELNLFVSVASAFGAAASIGLVIYGLRHAGRDRPAKPVLVEQLVNTAPYERLDNILSK
jgi:hypothetical protein